MPDAVVGVADGNAVEEDALAPAVIGLLGGLAGAVLGVLGTVVLFNLTVSEDRRSARMTRLHGLLEVLADVEAAVQDWYTAHRVAVRAGSDVGDDAVGRAKSRQVTSLFRLRVLAAGVDGMSGIVDGLARRCEHMVSRADPDAREAYVRYRDEVARWLAETIRVTEEAPIGLADRLLGRFRAPAAVSFAGGEPEVPPESDRRGSRSARPTRSA